MSSHYIYLACSYPGCDTRESVYTGDKYTDEFSGIWEGETITVRCVEHEGELDPITPEVGGDNTEALADVRAFLAKTLDNIEGETHPWDINDVAQLITVALEFAIPALPQEGNTEYGIRGDGFGHVLNWGPRQQDRDPANFPGYTLVSRKVGDWEPLTPKEQ